MKFTVLLSILLSATVACATISNDDPKTVERVDLERYQGLWYEIVKIPNKFQDQCLANVTAEYEVKENGRVKVTNSCDNDKGEREAAVGEAKSKNDGNSKLKVTFVKLFGKWVYVAGGDYWVMGLSEDYSYAVVGNPNREFGWILARSPSIPKSVLEEGAQILEANGFDLCKFQSTPQDGGFESFVSLCDILERP